MQRGGSAARDIDDDETWRAAPLLMRVTRSDTRTAAIRYAAADTPIAMPMMPRYCCRDVDAAYACCRVDDTPSYYADARCCLPDLRCRCLLRCYVTQARDIAGHMPPPCRFSHTPFTL